MLGELDSNSMNSPKILWILIGIPAKPFKMLQNSGIPKDFESAGFEILHELFLSFLEILKFLGTQFSVVHGGGGGVDIFWNSPFVFIVCPKKKISMFCSLTDKIPINQKAYIVYQFTCPWCNKAFIGKNRQMFLTRMKKHGTRTDQPLHQHLTKCEAFQELCNLFTLPDLNEIRSVVNAKEHVLNAV